MSCAMAISSAAGRFLHAAAASKTVALFDGTPSSLDQWRSVPRLPNPPFESLLRRDEEYRKEVAYQKDFEDASRAKAKWTVEDGALIGRQEREDLGLGGYLVTRSTWENFEIEFSAWPDWGADCGVLVRATADGNTGLQICIEPREGGSIGGYHGNGVGPFRATPFAVKGVLDASGKLGAIEEGSGSPPDNTPLAYRCTFAEFRQAFRVNGWNHYRVRVEGPVSRITTWMNGLRLSELDTSVVNRNGVTGEAIRQALGTTGHISLECHSNGRDNRYMRPGLVVRFKEIKLTPL